MNKMQLTALIISFILFSSCGTSQRSAIKKDDGKIAFTIVQINDVYEIAPLDGGKAGGMARVATIKKQELKKNNNTLLVIAGDFLSPSVYNSLKYEGNRIRGKQMVDVMNSAGVDLAVFGNHEFDIPEADLQNRINESKFTWISSNTFHKKGTYIGPFVKQSGDTNIPFPQSYTTTLTDADGTTMTVGFIGLTLPFNKAGYVSYEDVFTTAQTHYDKLKGECDAVVAITHQSLDDDIKLARQIPGLALIIGGHEHERHYARIDKVYITKADANAKSAYIIKLNFSKKKNKLKIKTELVDLDEKVLLDSATNEVVQRWTDIANNNYSSLGFDATKVSMQVGEPLDGREAYIRATQTNFTKLIVKAMEKASTDSDICIVNSGSIRVDDILPMPVTQYDVIRSLPFGGSILEVDMKGSLLVKILNAGKKNIGNGGFLQYSAAATLDAGTRAWLLNAVKIDNAKVYKIAISDFLMTGGEANLEFLTKDNPDIVKLYPVFADLKDPRSDIRRAIINYMEAQGN